MTDWGLTTSGSGSTASLSGWQYYMGGTSPNTADMQLDSITVRTATSGVSYRVGIYTGGTLTDVSGATLLEDLGEATSVGVDADLVINSTANPTIPANTLVWMIVTTDDGMRRNTASYPVDDISKVLRIFATVDPTSALVTNPTAAGADYTANVWDINLQYSIVASGPTLTGPSSVTEGTSTATVGTGQDTVTTLSIQTTDEAFSVEQTKGATVATGITFTPASGINACSIGVPAAGIPLVPTVSAAGITAYATEIKEV